MDISSSGIRLTSGEALEIGTKLEIRIAWPMGVGDADLTLYGIGRVVRQDGDCAAVAIRRFDFRTRSRGVDDKFKLRDGTSADRVEAVLPEGARQN